MSEFNPTRIGERLHLVQDVLNVFFGRKGFDEWWDEIDIETQQEIEQELSRIIHANE